MSKEVSQERMATPVEESDDDAPMDASEQYASDLFEEAQRAAFALDQHMGAIAQHDPRILDHMVKVNPALSRFIFKPFRFMMQAIEQQRERAERERERASKSDS